MAKIVNVDPDKIWRDEFVNLGEGCSVSSINNSLNSSTGRCVAAYTTLDRAYGKCGLIILWEKKIPKKELEMHTFLLNFNSEGIKRYMVKRLLTLQSQNWEDNLVGYVRIDFSEAVSLLQDAYKQNVKFGTRPADGWEKYSYFLDSEDPDIDRERFLDKLSFNNLNPIEFTNIYLAAIKRLDNAVLYDLSSSERQKRLGQRDDYLIYAGEDLAGYTLLKSKVISSEKLGKRRLVSVFIIASTPQDEIIKIDYTLVLIRTGKTLYLDNFQELNRTILSVDDPENPMNYRVFCSIYHLSSYAHILVRSWLEDNAEIFLTGEFEGGTCYKLLKPEEVASKSFDAISGIVCEFMLTDHELFIYAQKPFHLAKMERSLPLALKDKVFFKQKYNLPIRKLYKAAIMGMPLEELLKKKVWETGATVFSAFSAFLFWKGYGQIFDKLKNEALHVLQLDREAWYFFIERKSSGSEEAPVYLEYYISGNWLRLNVFNGNIAEELNKLGPYVDVVKEYEFQKQYGIFNAPSLGKERQWEMFKMLNLMGREAPSLKAMGLIPSVRGMARRLGTLVQ